jgi:hypothetical protein
MIFNYGTNNFKILRNHLNVYFDEYIKNQACSDYEKELIKIFNKMLTDDYIKKLSSLDGKKLTFHNWSDINDTINGNLLARQNEILIRIFNNEPANYSHGKQVIEALYLVLYADIYEASLLIKSIFQLSGFKESIEKFNSYSNKLSSESFEKITRLWFIIPKEVFTRHLDRHLDDEIVKTVEILKSNESFIEERISITNTLKEDIQKIKSSLEEQRREYNFIGLSDGFRLLRDQKKVELKWQNIAYYTLMITIILLIITKTTWSAYYLNINKLNSPIFIITTISTVLFLFILLYFFKISLVNVRSIKSQILQIDLRLTLCQFIHNYDSDTKGLREGMKESFERFESVIFAPIVATEDQMPATFDGLEQLTGLLSSFNKGSK